MSAGRRDRSGALILMVRGCTRTVMRWGVEYTGNPPIVFSAAFGIDAEIERALESQSTRGRCSRRAAPVDLKCGRARLIVYYHPPLKKLPNTSVLRFVMIDWFSEQSADG